jgi:hypothetical protein
VAYRNAVADLGRVRSHLRESLADKFFELPISEFLETVKSLATQTGPLENLGERNRLRSELQASGLQEVYEDFANLHLGREQLAANFDLVWWQSAFETLLELEPSLASHGSSAVSLIEKAFIEADEQHIALGVSAFNDLQSRHWKETIAANPSDGDRLKESHPNCHVPLAKHGKQFPLLDFVERYRPISIRSGGQPSEQLNV